ncbi:VWA domain-containing protein [Thalassococcus sp. S3]|uniref:VWA domain-containing protein n=1 Tax=Thalassococcus sp. S3 TaxID=2017482 RepID=UPI0010240431|nr:VWA domain-containing protein [Thalassococcus sp. S3]QBF33427.1 VWA containing CoxE family protein [Thalassococcus sp. S3]
MRRPVDRWRLLLGRYADRQFGACLGGMDTRRDRALDYLYGREYQQRGVRPAGGPRSAGLDPTQMKALDWLSDTKGLFPQKVFETLQTDAIERYQLTDLLKDPKVWEEMPSTPGMLRALLTFRDRADPQVQAEVRRIAQKVIDEIMEKLKAKLARSMSGRRNRHMRSPMKSAANFDARGTIRANLKTWDDERKLLIADQLRFMSRQKRHLDWTVILCVDQSGSMTESLIFSALMAAVLGGLPGVQVKMVLFDTSVVDVTGELDDPLSLLLSVQLGGGTNIGKAVSYCEDLVEQPNRTVFALVSDFYEGAAPRALLAAVARLNEARVKMLGIAALDDRGVADFDRDMAGKLAQLGMNVGAMTPDAFADWLAGVMR